MQVDLFPSKLGCFLKKMQAISKTANEKQTPKRKGTNLTSTSSSINMLNGRTPSQRVLAALGIGEDQWSRRSRRKTHSKRKSSLKPSELSPGRKAVSRSIKKQPTDSNYKHLIESNSEAQISDRSSFNPTSRPKEFYSGSVTERGMNIVNNFNVKFNPGNSRESIQYEISDLKLNLQMKILEINTLNHEISTLKSSVKLLEQDNLQLRQTVDEFQYQLKKREQKSNYYKSLVEMKNGELSSMNNKIISLQKQIKASFSDSRSSNNVFADCGTSLIQPPADGNHGLGSIDTELAEINVNEKERSQITNGFLDWFNKGKIVEADQVKGLIALISSPQSPKDVTTDLAEAESIVALYHKFAKVISIVLKTMQTDFVSRQELIKTSANIHHHYVTKMSMKQAEFQQSLGNAETLIRQYERMLGGQMAFHTETSVQSQLSGETEHLENYIDEEEFYRLQNHELESVSLIYSGFEKKP